MKNYRFWRCDALLGDLLGYRVRVVTFVSQHKEIKVDYRIHPTRCGVENNKQFLSE